VKLVQNQKMPAAMTALPAARPRHPGHAKQSFLLLISVTVSPQAPGGGVPAAWLAAAMRYSAHWSGTLRKRGKSWLN
jgi:hypothetical protein